MGARPGMVAPPVEPLSCTDSLEPGEYADLRLWVSAVVRRGGHLEPGYSKVNNLSRTVRARLYGRVIGAFVQYRKGIYAATNQPMYGPAGWGFLEI
jgi:hypothetical protein